jgi:hypothetical protein
MSETIFWEEVGVGSIDPEKKIRPLPFSRTLTGTETFYRNGLSGSAIALKGTYFLPLGGRSKPRDC